MKNKMRLIIIILFAILLNPSQIFGEERIVEYIRIYNNGYRAVIRNGKAIYYEQREDSLKVKNRELAENLINSGGAKLILEAEIKQYGNKADNVNILVGGYTPTFIEGDTWNKNNFSDKGIRDIMNNQEGIAVVVSYDTHWDYGGPGSSFNNSLQGAFKNLMSQAEFELKNSGMTQNTTTLTSYSTGHYLAMDYLTDQTRDEFNIIGYNAVAPNIRGSVLENNFQKLEGGDAYYDIIKSSAYTAIFNSNPYFRDNVKVNVYFTTQDFKQDTFSAVYYTDEKEEKAKLKDIATNSFWQVKDEYLKLYLPDATIHTDPQKIYAQLNNQTIPYYQQNETWNITYYGKNGTVLFS